MYLLRSRYIMLLLLSLSHIRVLLLGLSLVPILSKHCLEDCSHHCDLSKPPKLYASKSCCCWGAKKEVWPAPSMGLPRHRPQRGKADAPAALPRPQPWRGGQSGSKWNKALLLCRRVGLTNRSTGRISARDNQYTSSAILTYTRPKFIASSTIPLFDISSASHNYDTSSSIHKFDITRYTTCSISIWVSEYKCIMSS